jgi:hypothetical protein
MTTEKKQAVSKKKEKPSLKCEDLEKAHDTLQDYFNRASVNFMAIGETAHAIYYEEGLSGDCLEVGIKPTELSSYAFSTLKDLISGFGTASEPVEFNIGTIPVRMYILRRDSEVFKYPDQKFYGQEVYMLPNPFVKYYKNREYFE